MAYGRLSLLLTKRRLLNPKTPFFHSHHFSTSQNPNPKPSSLSARLSFVFDQIDAIEKERSQKHETLQRIRAWRDSKNTHNQIPEQPVSESPPPPPTTTTSSSPEESDTNINSKPVELVKKEVEFVHPWPEWIQLMERLVHQNYFDHRRKDEDKMVQELGFDSSEIVHDEGHDFTKDFKSVHAACLNFGKDRFDLLRYVDFN